MMTFILLKLLGDQHGSAVCRTDFRLNSLCQQENEKLLTEVFAQLTDEATEDNKRRELVRLKMMPKMSTI